ncbi:uncharacterized protein Dyak_GE28942 [Drosophila yakuba]|uniref:Uncharacterized protein n=1 Tax=Drosophila yakuba TaxID=7245 RepID=A0A0R1E9P5_DROYA|nr:uncharacterized protein Dyak_GE28942 [Drosophila yakuba]
MRSCCKRDSRGKCAGQLRPAASGRRPMAVRRGHAPCLNYRPVLPIGGQSETCFHEREAARRMCGQSGTEVARVDQPEEAGCWYCMVLWYYGRLGSNKVANWLLTEIGRKSAAASTSGNWFDFFPAHSNRPKPPAIGRGRGSLCGRGQAEQRPSAQFDCIYEKRFRPPARVRSQLAIRHPPSAIRNP